MPSVIAGVYRVRSTGAAIAQNSLKKTASKQLSCSALPTTVSFVIQNTTLFDKNVNVYSYISIM